MLRPDEIREGIERLAPFHHEIELAPGLWTRLPEEPRPGRRITRAPRVRELTSHAFPTLLEAFGGSLEGKDVLDAACNCGGFSVEAKRLGARRVLGVDVVERYVEQARFVEESLGFEGMEFRQLDLNDLSPEAVGEFDVTFCFGILYHLEDPVGTMRRLAAVTREAMLVDTTTLAGFEERPFWRMNFVPPAAEGRALPTTNLWRDRERVQFEPSVEAVRGLLEHLGFGDVRPLEPTSEHLSETYRDGRRTTFFALKDCARVAEVGEGG